MNPTDEEINLAKISYLLNSISNVEDRTDEEVQTFMHDVLLSDNDEIRQNIASNIPTD